MENIVVARAGLRKAAPYAVRQNEPATQRDAPLPWAVSLLIWAGLAAMAWGLIALVLYLI